VAAVLGKAQMVLRVVLVVAAVVITLDQLVVLVIPLVLLLHKVMQVVVNLQAVIQAELAVVEQVLSVVIVILFLMVVMVELGQCIEVFIIHLVELEYEVGLGHKEQMVQDGQIQLIEVTEVHHPFRLQVVQVLLLFVTNFNRKKYGTFCRNKHK
jgi:hypothetical protein